VKPVSFVIITGLSGSGKGTFLRALEDRGYFCVDNLPVGLVSKFYELTLKSEEETTKVAMVIDVREGESLRKLPSIYAELKKEEGVAVSLWCPWPLLPGWTVTGVGWAGDDRTGVCRTHRHSINPQLRYIDPQPLPFIDD